MTTSRSFKLYTTSNKLEFKLSTNKKGTVRATYWSMGRTWPLKVSDAKALEAEGRAVEVPMLFPDYMRAYRAEAN